MSFLTNSTELSKLMTSKSILNPKNFEVLDNLRTRITELFSHMLSPHTNYYTTYCFKRQ